MQLFKKITEMLLPQKREFKRIWPSIEPIEGFLVSPIQEEWLFKKAKSLPDNAVIVEIGSFKGRSTTCLAYGCKKSNKHIYAIDTFQGNDVDFHRRNFFDEFKSNLEKRNLMEYVTPLKGTSVHFAEGWKIPVHMLFIDASHQFEDVLADFNAFFPHVVQGGIVALHDVVETWPGPLRAWEEIVKSQLKDTGMCSTIACGTKP
jgi:predicted O-methyltransferase YrrM